MKELDTDILSIRQMAICQKKVCHLGDYFIESEGSSNDLRSEKVFNFGNSKDPVGVYAPAVNLTI